MCRRKRKQSCEQMPNGEHLLHLLAFLSVRLLLFYSTLSVSDNNWTGREFEVRIIPPSKRIRSTPWTEQQFCFNLVIVCWIFMEMLHLFFSMGSANSRKYSFSTLFIGRRVNSIRSSPFQNLRNRPPKIMGHFCWINWLFSSFLCWISTFELVCSYECFI